MPPANNICAVPDCPGREQGLWVQCDGCEEWLHYFCLGWLETYVPEEEYLCKTCRRQERRDHRMLVRQLTAATAQLEALARPAAPAGPTWWSAITWDQLLPTFQGEPHESPGEFCQKCSAQFTQDRVPANQWVRLTTRQLKGVAAQWWTLSGEEEADWETFRGRLIARFDDISILANLRAHYYGYRQTTEDTEQFIATKIRLHRRLFPNETEEMTIPYLVEMLNDQVRPFLRNPLPVSFDALLAQARQRSQDLSNSPVENPANSASQVARNQQCYHCGQATHFIRNCPYLQQGSAAKNEKMGASSGERPPS